MAVPDPATTEWVPIWNPTTTGPIGPPGPQGPQGEDGPQGPIGPQGIQGPTGSSASILPYRVDITTTAPSDPGTARMRYNTANQQAATALYFDRLTDDGFDATVLLELMNLEDRFIIQSKSLAAKYQIFDRTGLAINHTDWFEVPVAFVSADGPGGPAGGVFTQLEQVVAILQAEGAEGPVGPVGPQGEQGEQGEVGPPGPTGGIHHLQHEIGGADIVDIKRLGGYPGGSALFLREDGTFQPAGSAGAAMKAESNVFTGAIQTIDAVRPELRLHTPGDTTYGRVASVVPGGRVDLISNLNYTGSAWVRDDDTKPGSLLTLFESGMFGVWNQAAGAASPFKILFIVGDTGIADFTNKVRIAAPQAKVVLEDTTAAAGSRKWIIENNSLELRLRATDDAEAPQGGYVSFARAGGLSTNGPITCQSVYTAAASTSLAELTVRGATNFQNGVACSAGDIAGNGALTVGGNVNCAAVVANSNIHTAASAYVYPGRVDVAAGGGIQGTWFLGSHGSYGLYSNTGLYTEGGVFCNHVEGRAHIRAGTDVYAGGRFNEASRPTWLGYWTHGNPASYVHGQMSGVSGTMSWTYVGKTMFLDCYFGGYFGGGYLVNCTIPEGVLPAVDIRIPVLLHHDEKPWGQGFAIFTAGQYYITVYNEGTINMSPSSVLYIAFTIALPMQ